jgi:glutaredoxin
LTKNIFFLIIKIKMKITVYTVSDCQFSKAEKEYLRLHGLPFEEKNLEQNREWLTEMLAVSNNFAGTPVTRIEKDDGTIVVLKGFTKEEFDRELGLTDQPVAQANAQVNITPSQAPSQPAPSQSTQTQQPTPMPNPDPTPVSQPNATSAMDQTTTNQPSIPPQPQVQNPSPAIDQKLNDILSNLEQKAQTNQAASPTSEDPVIPPSDLPNVPDFSAKQ